MVADATVFVVDDDEAVRDSLALLLETAGYRVQAFESGRAFLETASSLPFGCAVIDVRMPDIDGLELQDALRARGIEMPVIIMTGHADVPMAVRAMRAGAVDFVEKPFADHVILDSVARALTQAREKQREVSEVAAIRSRLETLTPREREVLDQLVRGHPNKVSAANLGISPRTVEIHRARVMEKMQAHSLSELVRMVLSVGAAPKA
ncbi:MAG TPA: response regulator FixJ [Alphaproteobacteria bacterium]